MHAGTIRIELKYNIFSNLPWVPNQGLCFAIGFGRIKTSRGKSRTNKSSFNQFVKSITLSPSWKLSTFAAYVIPILSVF